MRRAWRYSRMASSRCSVSRAASARLATDSKVWPPAHANEKRVEMTVNARIRSLQIILAAAVSPGTMRLATRHNNGMIHGGSRGLARLTLAVSLAALARAQSMAGGGASALIWPAKGGDIGRH